MVDDASTGHLKMKACKVFGEAVMEDLNGSLYYSPSPSVSSKKVALHETSTQSEESSPAPATVLFESGKHGDSMEDAFTESDKENKNMNSSLSKNNSIDSTVPAEEFSNVKSTRKEELKRLRAASPLKRDRVNQAQHAINIASESVNKSLNVSKKKKTRGINAPIKKTRKVRFQWKEDYAEAKSFNESLENSRRHILALKRELASKHFKEQARKQQEDRKKHLAKLEEEYKFNSQVFCDHQRKLKEESDKKRRQSEVARAKIRENNRDGEHRLKEMRDAEEAAIMESRNDSSRALRNTIRQKVEQRRKSFAFRGGDARRIRDLRAAWKSEKLKEQYESYDLERKAAKDAEDYKTKIRKERRESLERRNRDARRVRQKELKEATAAMEEEHASYELKWAGERDVAEYRKKMKEERRKSLKNRNKESKQHADVMKELHVLAQEKETESFLLKWAGENDAKQYIEKVAEERRKSLQLRGEQSKRHREYEKERHYERVEAAAVEGALQSACQKDIENYKKECAERKRKSLALRAKEVNVQRIEEKARTLEEREVESKNFELESMARTDVEAYLNDCKARRRQSLAFRAKERRRHGEWKQKQREKEIQEKSRSTHERAWDTRHIELAKQKERAQMAIKALRDVGCSVDGNPFANILDL